MMNDDDHREPCGWGWSGLFQLSDSLSAVILPAQLRSSNL